MNWLETVNHRRLVIWWMYVILATPGMLLIFFGGSVWQGVGVALMVLAFLLPILIFKVIWREKQRSVQIF